MTDNTIYQGWHEDGTIKITVKRKDAEHFLVIREDGVDEPLQALTEMYRADRASRREIIVTSGYLYDNQIPTAAYEAMWNAIINGKGLNHA